MNRVEIIGICLEVNSSYMLVEVQDTKPLKLFFNDDVNYEMIEVGKYTKVLGYLEADEFPFPIVKIEKVYQIKENVN